MHEAAAIDHAVNADVNHETSDVYVRPIIWFGVGLAAFLVAASVLVVGLFDWFEHLERQSDKKLPALAKRERLTFPKDLHRIPGPILQASEEADLKRLREAEEAALSRSTDGRVPLTEALKQMSDPDF